MLLANGEAQVLPGVTDTAFADVARGRVGTGASFTLANTGVPFVFIDRTVRNSLRYFYSVTAFDVNSLASGPSSLESARVAKAVIPTPQAANDKTVFSTVAGVFARDQLAPAREQPRLDPEDGTFSGPFPPADGGEVSLGSVVPQLVGNEGGGAARLDSITMGAGYANIPHIYWFTVGPLGLDPATSSIISYPFDLPEETGLTQASTNFSAGATDASKAARYGGSGSFVLPGTLEFAIPGTDYLTLPGRGCVNARPGFGTGTSCSYPGSRWFAGPSPQNNETQADPAACNTANFSGVPMTCFNNSGALPGVTNIFQALCYFAAGGGGCREHTGITAGVKRAADYNVFWGEAGVIDSVIDVTHGAVVPFNAGANATWGILNPAVAAAGSPDGSPILTDLDFACVEPFRTLAAGAFVCPGAAYAMSNTAIPGPVGFFSGGGYPPAVPIVPATDAGFGMYIVGDKFTFELAGGALPADGTVWTLRAYVGAITGGQGAAAIRVDMRSPIPKGCFRSRSSGRSCDRASRRRASCKPPRRTISAGCTPYLIPIT